MISIIIPALNEEKHLPFLLQSIKDQNFNDYEIIVADAGSKDKTVKIAEDYGCRITKGGSPARGRNNGAKIAKGDLLLFLDADVILPPNVLPSVLEEFKRRRLKIATFRLLPLDGDDVSSFIFTFFYNLPITLLEKILPHAAMGILIKKNLFKELNGFDEEIKLAEDHDLARRAKKLKLGKYGILKSAKLLVSTRRFKRDGWLKTGSKYLLSEGHMILIGPIKTDIFKYRFDHYNEKKKAGLIKLIDFPLLYNKQFFKLKWKSKIKNPSFIFDKKIRLTKNKLKK